jgi:hypothetical protein
MTACTQPGCTGMIADGYCDVCGSPADAVPVLPAAASAAPPNPADQLGPTARQAPRPQLATQERADLGTADPGAVDTQQVDREKVGSAAAGTGKVDRGLEPAEGERDAAQDYRTRVYEAQLPDDVREAALCEVDKLQRTSHQSPESGDIRIWLDTILDLPWRTRTTDWIDVEGSREVEATLRGLIEPAAANIEQGDTAPVEPAAAELEQGDTVPVEPAAAELERGNTAQIQPAATELKDADTARVQPSATELVKAAAARAGTHDDDTAVMAAIGGRHPLPQLGEQQVLERDPVQTPAKKRRFGYLALAATVMAALLIGTLLFAAGRDRGMTAQSVPTVTATATATATKPTSEPTIQLEDFPDSARPFQTVRIEGTYPSGPDRFLQVQRWEGREWLDFPVPTKTNSSGQFTAFVELGQPGRYRLRVLDPGSGVTSKPFVLVIKG